jgi:membrane associated rhomboid family serine protease
MSVRVTYNAPVVLTFALLSFVIVLFNIYISDMTGYLASPGQFSWSTPGDYFNLFTYVFAHDTSGASKFSHFVANFTIILLIGPSVEEKYGAKNLVIMMAITAFITAVLNAIIFDHTIVGASGLALMMIILGSFTNYKKGDLPLTFIIICLFFLGNEIIGAFKDDNISQFAHIMGGLSGGFFGFYFNKR